MDAFLLISIIIIAIILLIANTYILIWYIHPDDKGFGDSLFPKLLVVIGLSLAWGQVLMLPLDVANSRGEGGGLDMDLFWNIVIIADAVLLVLLIPFAYFFYETDQMKGIFSRIGSAICSMVFFLIIFCLAFFITYAFWNKADIPVQLKRYDIENASGSVQYVALQPSTTPTTLSAVYVTEPTTTDTSIEITVSFPVYIMAFFSFIGWFLVVIFGGAGLFAIPLDMINAFRKKPVQKSYQELQKKKEELSKRTLELIKMGEDLKDGQKDAEVTQGFFQKRKVKSNLKKNMNRFKASVMLLEKELALYQMEENFSKMNPLFFVFKLILGIILFVVAILWWLQVLLNNVIIVNGTYPLALFLNNLLNWFQDTISAGFLATGVFAGLALYLIWAVTKGCVKVGVCIPFLVTIHPMKVNETMMNSFLFNVELILISSIAAIQFLSTTFGNYIRLTDVDMLFGIQVRHMKFFKYFYENRIFDIAFLAWSLLFMIILCACGGEDRAIKRQYEKLVQETERARKKVRA